MNTPLSRRAFLQRGTLLTGALISLNGTGTTQDLAARGPYQAMAASPNDRVRVGVIGCNNRGMDHLAGWLSVPNVEVAYVCDVDRRALSKGLAAATAKQGHAPVGVKDLREVLEDRSVDAVSIATPDHWHAPATILACAAGKHVYVEKPGSHNPRESELMVAAARKHQRVVQMGNQRRSWPWVSDTITAVRSGELGRVFLARGWYTNHRGTIGHGKAVPVPDWLDFGLWQGPAPERPYRDNLLPYNWHWFWHWGTGELGNNGVHAMDLARWGLAVDCPRRVTCGGGRYHFQDDWETPDTCSAVFDFGDKAIEWIGQSCDPRGLEGSSFGVSFFGENGSLVLAGSSASIYDLSDKLVREIKGKYDDVAHFANFIDGIRHGGSLKAEIEDGQRSTFLCHLGNIAWRSGQALKLDPATRKIIDNKPAGAFWGRTYRKGWEPSV